MQRTKRSHPTSSGRLLEGNGKKNSERKRWSRSLPRNDHLREVLILEFHEENFGVSDRRILMTGDTFRDAVAS